MRDNNTDDIHHAQRQLTNFKILTPLRCLSLNIIKKFSEGYFCNLLQLQLQQVKVEIALFSLHPATHPPHPHTPTHPTGVEVELKL